MTRSIRKYEVPADEKSHILSLTGGILFIDASRDVNELDVWTDVSDAHPSYSVKLRVFKDGQDIPDDAVYQGTTGRTLDGAVWHLFEVFA